MEIVLQMARGLAAAHRHGIVHRDVKPENVMLRVDGYVKLVDFGLAKVLPWTGDSTEKASSAPTLTGQITGTFSYMSPEQARGQRVGPASDVFSFGIVLYEMLTGEHPFRADTPIDTLNRIITAEPVSTKVRCPELPPEIHSVVERCLKKDHTERFQSAADLEAELQRSPAAPSALQKRSRWRPAAVAVFLAVLLGIFIWMWNPRSIPGAGLAAVRSIAVMNFRVSSEDAVTAALAQGLSEELGAALSREGFLVPPRSRVLALPASIDVKAAGAQLQVDSILEGSVTNLNDSFRVRVELADTNTGFQIWNNSVTPNQTDALAGGSETAREIARQLRAASGGGR